MAERNDFIRDIIDEDLRTGRHTRVATRFPPEPNGYLHIGHAKSICLNFGIARDYQGRCNLRYDDTNPAKEDVEYVDSIERDVRWLGFDPDAVLFSADYFGKMYELAERLVVEGKAYVCDLDEDQIREYRGTLSEPGKPSPFRERTPDDNLARLRRMKAGELPDGACTLRARGDMASPNMKMRDPLLYRIRHAHHHRSGDAWCIYPMYDYAHPLEDAIEGITHSICTLEFENNRELYDWVLDNTGPWDPRPRQYEFARLQLDYTVMSKRKLLLLVQERRVSGWDDPRMPTIAAMRRRGYSPDAIRAFADMIGVAKANSWVDIGKLEYCVRDDLNRNAPRVMGVLRPIEVELVGLPADAPAHDAPYFPPDVGKPGSRPLAIGDRIYIERDDWRDEPPGDYHRLAPGGGKNPGDGRKVAGVIHWVDAATAVPAEVRLYDRLFRTARPEDGGDFLQQLAPDSLEVVRGAWIEASLASAAVGSRWQLERVGYFAVDEDARPGALVLNRIVTLRDARVEARPEPDRPDKDREKTASAKAKTRPKSKSPVEYRAEARARDPELAAAHTRIAAIDGISADHADLLTGDLPTARLFLAATDAVGFPVVAAKWIINELPRALAGKELAEAGLDAPRFAELVHALGEDRINPSAAKQALAEMIRTGKRLSELDAARAGGQISAGELSAQVEAVIAANQDKAAQYRAGKTGLLGFFVGQVMKSAPGADAAEVNKELRARLG
jgi:glutaminyl-tRNA synthetase